MTDAFSGGCACGALRYEITDAPLAMSDCQCRDCQRRSGTGHGSYLTFPTKARVRVEGQASTWQVAADNGNVKTHAFCPHCGAPVYLTFSAMPDLFTIHAASLDEPSRYQPSAVTYTVRGHAWDSLAPTLVKFEKMPA